MARRDLMASITEEEREDLKAILADIIRGLGVVREAEGFGEITVRITVRPKGLASWDVAPAFSRKPRAGEK